MPGLSVSFVLAFTVIRIVFQIVGLLDLLERVNNPVFLFPVRRKVKSLVAVPVHVLLCPLLVDMVTVPDVESAVIVLRVISAVLPRPSIVSCEFHWAKYDYKMDIAVKQKEAFADGMNVGMEKGKLEGSQQKAIEAARSFIKMNILSPEQIAQGTGLPIETVRELADEIAENL